VGLDQLLLEDEGFCFGIGDDQRNITGQRNHDLDADVMGGGTVEIGTNPTAEGLCLADIKHISTSVLEEINPWTFG
jgi:hypothetical protein